MPEGTAIVGGIADDRPYFGALKMPPGFDVWKFMLATCGCGNWRVLMSTRDGGQRWQFPVQLFTSRAPYDLSEDVAVFGHDGEDPVSGTLSQSSGRFSGVARRGIGRFAFDSRCAENHANDASACVKCHIGDDPICPQPNGHPHFELDPPNCLTCHQVGINE